MTKIVVKKIKLDYPKIILTTCLGICAAPIIYGVVIVSTMEIYKGLCPWDFKERNTDKIHQNDLKDVAINLGIFMICNWIFAMVEFIFVYKMGYNDLIRNVLVDKFTGLFTLSFVALIPVTFTTILMCLAFGYITKEATSCVFNEHDGIIWILVSLVPSIVPAVTLSVAGSFALFHLLKYCFTTLSNITFSSLLCCSVVEEVEDEQTYIIPRKLHEKV